MITKSARDLASSTRGCVVGSEKISEVQGAVCSASRSFRSGPSSGEEIEGLVEGCLSKQHGDQALLALDAEGRADLGLSEIPVDQDHLAPREGERGGQVDRGGRLPLGRRGAGDQHGLGPPVVRASLPE